MTRKKDTAPRSPPVATAKTTSAVQRRRAAPATEAGAPKSRRTATPKTESATTRPAVGTHAGTAPTARRQASSKNPALAPIVHPHSVANLAEVAEIDRVPDQPFAEGIEDGLDADLRQRMISERAFRLYCERGGAEGYDLDDWLQAEAEVDHLLLNPAAR